MSPGVVLPYHQVCLYSIELFHTYCHKPGQSRVELSNLEWYYYWKITTPASSSLQYRAIPCLLPQSRAEQSKVINPGMVLLSEIPHHLHQDQVCLIASIQCSAELSSPEWYYYQKIITPAPPLHITTIQGRSEQSYPIWSGITIRHSPCILPDRIFHILHHKIYQQ